jgi:hypothetical protein
VLYVLFVLCRSLHCLCVYMCTVLLPPGGYPIAVKYIMSCHIILYYTSYHYPSAVSSDILYKLTVNKSEVSLLCSQHFSSPLSQIQPINIYIIPLNAELSPICHFLALLGAHHILHISGVRVIIILPSLLRSPN